MFYIYVKKKYIYKYVMKNVAEAFPSFLFF